MRILLVDELFPPVHCGGAEIAARDIAAEIGRNHEVVVFTPSYGHAVGTEDAGNFQILRYRNRFTPIGSLLQQKLLFATEMTKNLAGFARVFRPEVIHAQNALSALSVARVAEMHRIVGIVHVRDHRFECFTSRVACRSRRDATLLDFARCVENPFQAIAFPYARLITKLIRRALAKCGRAFAVSNYLRSELMRNVTIDVRACYDGIDVERIRRIEPAREVRGRSCEPDSTIVYAGGLHKFKGILELLDGLRMVRRKMPQISLLVAGDGPHKKAVQKLIEAGNLRANVSVLGRLPHDDLISTIKASGAVIVPSLLPEAGSRVIMEALACSRPVLASDRGANPEMIGPAGLTFPPDAGNIACAILSLLSNREKLQELSHLAARRSLRFSINTTCSHIVQSYKEWLR